MDSKSDMQKQYEKILSYKRSHAKLKSPTLAKYNGRSGALPPLKSKLGSKSPNSIVSHAKSTEVLNKPYI